MIKNDSNFIKHGEKYEKIYSKLIENNKDGLPEVVVKVPHDDIIIVNFSDVHIGCKALDLDLLKELHTFGSVRNLKDRRTDLYSLSLNHLHLKSDKWNR